MNEHTMSIRSKLRRRVESNSVCSARNEERTYTSARGVPLRLTQACVKSGFELLSALGRKRCFGENKKGSR